MRLWEEARRMLGSIFKARCCTSLFRGSVYKEARSSSPSCPSDELGTPHSLTYCSLHIDTFTTHQGSCYYALWCNNPVRTELHVLFFLLMRAIFARRR